MERETIIDKVKKLFALAGNNPSESEATLAALKAQELLAKNNISMEEIFDDEPEEIVHDIVWANNRQWRSRLANIIAPNFKCRCFLRRKNSKRGVVFVGHETDVKVAIQTFDFLFKTGGRLANEFVRQRRSEGYRVNGLYNSYVIGFCHGIKAALDQQCRALMIIVPEDVNDNYTQYIKETNMKSWRPRLEISNARAYNEGKAKGLETMSKKRLSA